MEVDKYEGLEKIPIEIKSKGTQEIARYILDLAQASKSIYRTKLIVVGPEGIEKARLLDCLFPLTEEIKVPNFFGSFSNKYFTLEGKYLNQYNQGKFEKKYILESKEWIVTKKIKKEFFQEERDIGIEIERIKEPKEKVEMYFRNEETRNVWFERISRLVSNKATHEIELNTYIWESSTLNQHQQYQNFIAKKNENLKVNEDKNQGDYIEFSTWDFAGQNDFYNTHHYFLSNRSTFLVLYQIDQGIKGLESLNFWLKSLSSHLNQNYCDENGKSFYSIIIVGTFLDSISNNQNDKDKNLRQTKVMEIYNKNGLKSPPFYFEVSCPTLQNIGELREIIFHVSLSHSYMGENVPVGYLTIEKSIIQLRKLKQGDPILDIQDLIFHAQSQSSFKFDTEFVKKALKLLHEWGTCIYFDEPIELSNIVILDPQYFTNTILNDLFNGNGPTRQIKINGIIEYFELPDIWNGSTNLIDTYLLLLEKFEVCFILEDRQSGNKKGNKKKIIIPNLLPDPYLIKETRSKNSKLMKELEKLTTSNQKEKDRIMNRKNNIQEENRRMDEMESDMKEIHCKLERKLPPTIPRGEIEIERMFSFNHLPNEMISRLLVRFQKKIVDNLIWRRGVLLKSSNNENILCLLDVNMRENLFEIRIRGKDRNECLEMMKYIYEEVKTVSRNYGGITWRECVRSPHFSKGLIDLDAIHQDCKLELKDRKLICPITHFPIYGEELLINTGLLDTLNNYVNFGIFHFFF